METFIFIITIIAAICMVLLILRDVLALSLGEETDKSRLIAWVTALLWLIIATLRQ